MPESLSEMFKRASALVGPELAGPYLRVEAAVRAAARDHDERARRQAAKEAAQVDWAAEMAALPHLQSSFVKHGKTPAIHLYHRDHFVGFAFTFLKPKAADSEGAPALRWTLHPGGGDPARWFSVWSTGSGAHLTVSSNSTLVVEDEWNRLISDGHHPDVAAKLAFEALRGTRDQGANHAPAIEIRCSCGLLRRPRWGDVMAAVRRGYGDRHPRRVGDRIVARLTLD